MNLDMFTLMAANALVGILLSLVMEMFARRHDRHSGFGWLSLAYLALGVGHGLVAMRGQLPGIWSISVGNGLLSLALVFMHVGIQIFRDIKSKYKVLNLFLCACMFAATYYFGLVNQNLAQSTLAIHTVIALQILIFISALFRDEKRFHHFSKYVVAVPFGLMVVLLVYGMITIYDAPPKTLFIKSGWDQTLPNFIAFFVMVITSLGFIWMSVDRAEDELSDMNKELKESLANAQKISIKLQEQNNFLADMMNAVPAPIFYKDAEGVYKNANRAFYTATGLSPKQVIGKNAEDIASRHNIDTTREVDEALLKTSETKEYETQLLFKDGLRHEVIVNKATFRDSKGKIAGIIGTITDITERKINESKVQHMALHDQLTGLFNRNMFFAHLDKALAKAKRHNQSLAVLYIDLDGFKEINDELGHDAGDMVLKVVGKRLNSFMRESDTVCRLGGDEFAVLAEMVDGRDGLTSIAEKIISSISDPIIAMGNECRVGASVGIAIYPDHASHADGLMKNADTAMYKAKEQGKGGYYIYGD